MPAIMPPSLEPSRPSAQPEPSGPSSPKATLTGVAKYRGAVVEDLDPPPALSVTPLTPISSALMSAYERDFSHLTVIDQSNRALLGYLNIDSLKAQLKRGEVRGTDGVQKAMSRFRRRREIYKVITMDTPLEELEAFFEGEGSGEAGGRDFAVVTDASRRFVLGVATKPDLEEFVRRRPG